MVGKRIAGQAVVLVPGWLCRSRSECALTIANPCSFGGEDFLVLPPPAPISITSDPIIPGQDNPLSDYIVDTGKTVRW
jgi:hypothetical protein